MSVNDIRSFTPFDPSRIQRVMPGRVIIRRDVNPEKVGALFIPQTSRYMDRADMATVIGVGTDIDDVKAGDRLLLPDLMDCSGKFTHDGMTYTVLDKEQLGQVAVVEEE